MQSSPQTPGPMPNQHGYCPSRSGRSMSQSAECPDRHGPESTDTSAAGDWQQRARLQATGLVRLRMAIAIAAGPWSTAASAAASAAAALGPPRVGALDAVLLIVLLHIAVLAVLTHQDLAPSHLLAIEGIHGCHCLSFTARSAS